MASAGSQRGDVFNATKSKDFNSNEQSTSSKKPFNKKLWRQNHYKSKFGNANEGHSVGKNREIVKEYRKMLHREAVRPAEGNKGQSVAAGDHVAISDVISDETSSRNNAQRKMSAITKARLEYRKKMEEKEKKKQELVRVRKEKEAALKRYRERKFARYGKMSKRTKKGQPVMKERMELLLESLERQLESERN